MSPRRRPRLLPGRRATVAAALVAGTAGLLVAPAPAGAVTQPTTRVAARSCVAVVVDSGAAATGRCTTWRSGVTGLGALSATGHSFRFAPSGLVCAIDGFPSGCHVDPTHYWSYWHRSAGASAWSYSNEGAATYRPAVNSTEGWAYQNGSPRQPRSSSFTTICPPASPSPTPTTGPRPPAPSRPPATHAPAASHPAAPAGAAATASRVTGRTAATSPTGRPADAGATPGRPATATGSPSAASRLAGSQPASSGAPSSSRDRPSGALTPVSSRTPASPTHPLLLAGLGLLLAAGLGGAAWRRTRTRP